MKLLFLPVLLLIHSLWNGTNLNDGASNYVEPPLTSVLLSRQDFGAKCDGVTSDNEAFSRALRVSRIVVVPNKTCLVDSLHLPSGTTITGFGAISQIVPGPTGVAFIVGSPGNPVHDITITRLGFFAQKKGESPRIAVLASAASTINILECRSQDVELFASNPHIEFKKANDDIVVSEITLEDNECTSSQTKFGACAEFRYASNVRARNNRISGFRHGLFYWGGDAKIDDGPVTKHWASDITFENNDVRGCGEGGLWGSMGDRVRYLGNHINAVGDVGLDFEGTRDGLASENICSEARNGCAATFFRAKSIRFENNRMSSNSYQTPIVRIYDSTQEPHDTSVLFRRNTFVCTAKTNACSVDNRGGPTGFIEFEENVLTNTKIDLTANNTTSVSIKNNKLTFTVLMQEPAISVASYGAGNKISGNQIHSSVLQAKSLAAIRVRNVDFNHNIGYWIESNSIDGFQNAISLIAEGANPGTSVAFLGCGNKLNGGSVTHEFDRARQKVIAVAQLEVACQP